MTRPGGGSYGRPVTAVYVLLWGSWALFGVSAVWALVWAIRNGHFRQPSAAARSIFDDDEPMGVMTDSFPGEGVPGRDGR